MLEFNKWEPGYTLQGKPAIRHGVETIAVFNDPAVRNDAISAYNQHGKLVRALQYLTRAVTEQGQNSLLVDVAMRGALKALKDAGEAEPSPSSVTGSAEPSAKAAPDSSTKTGEV